MTIEEAKQKIIEVIVESTETDMEIGEDTELYEDMGLASVEVYVMLCDLEEVFGISIPASALRRIRKVGDLCELVIDRLSKN